MITQALLFIFPLCMAVTLVSDAVRMTIPDSVSMALLAFFIVLALWIGLPVAQIGMHLLCGLVVFLVCLGLFAAGVMGGGDAKVLTASAVWFGFGSALMSYLLMISLLGGVLSLIFVVVRSRSDLLLASRIPLPAHFYDSKAGVPYGIAIGIAGLVCYAQSGLMLHSLGPVVS